MGYRDAPLGDLVVLGDRGDLVGLVGNRGIHRVVLEGLEAWGENKGVRPVVLEVGRLVGRLVGCRVGLLRGQAVLADCNYCSELQVGADGKVGVVPRYGDYTRRGRGTLVQAGSPQAEDVHGRICDQMVSQPVGNMGRTWDD